MSILLFVVFGLVVGLLARAIMPGKQPMGWVATALLGIAGITASRDQRLTEAYGPFEPGLVGHAPESSPTRPSSESSDLDRWYHEPDSAA